MLVKALDNFDNVRRGDEVDLPPKYAEGVVAKGLAELVDEASDKADADATATKQAEAHANKMDGAPANKRTARGNGAGNA